MVSVVKSTKLKKTGTGNMIDYLEILGMIYKIIFCGSVSSVAMIVWLDRKYGG